MITPIQQQEHCGRFFIPGENDEEILAKSFPGSWIRSGLLATDVLAKNSFFFLKKKKR